MSEFEQTILKVFKIPTYNKNAFSKILYFFYIIKFYQKHYAYIFFIGFRQILSEFFLTETSYYDLNSVPAVLNI